MPAKVNWISLCSKEQRSDYNDLPQSTTETDLFRCRFLGTARNIMPHRTNLPIRNQFYFLLGITSAMSTILISRMLLVQGDTQDGELIGSFYSCGHALRGDILMQNGKEIFICGFNYDGVGPTAWFYGQLRPVKSTHTSRLNNYVTLAFPGPRCERLGKGYENKNVTLIMPRSITDLEAIGIFCYQYCRNFGHIIIPVGLSPAPDDLEGSSECSKPNYTLCENPLDGNIKFDCDLGSPINNQNGKATSGNILSESGNNRSDKKGTSKSIAVRFTYPSVMLTLEILVWFINCIR